jgi:hypothetical protein
MPLDFHLKVEATNHFIDSALAPVRKHSEF